MGSTKTLTPTELLEYFHSGYTKEQRRPHLTECWIWQRGKHYAGYGSMRGEIRGAHRYSVSVVKGETIPKGMFVCHRCDVPECCNPEHLFVGTHKENMADKQAKGRGARGSMQNKSSLTDQDVLDIRASSDSNKVLAHKHGVTAANIRYIRNRKTWTHI